MAIPGKGKIEILEDLVIKGTDSAFKTQLSPGDMIIIKGLDVPEQIVDKIESDSSLTLKLPGLASHNIENKPYEYKVVPKLDQSQVYKAVWDRLSRSQSIGIFPEGGSHDRTDLLPIKAGVSIMALGAMAINPKTRVSIVACGLKYFKPARFRSKVIVEFSRPFRIPTEYV